MNFHDLGQALRRETKRRLDAGELTQQQIASLTGFRQAHISNYLNGRRALSLAGLDRLLRSQNIDIQDLMPGRQPPGLTLRAGEALACIPVVEDIAWATPEPAEYPDAWCMMTRASPRLRPPAERAHWQRLIALQAAPASTPGMSTLLPAGSLAVVDRYDILPPPPAKPSGRIYAIWLNAELRFTHIEDHRTHKLVRPHDPAEPALLLLDTQFQIIGRVCSISRPA